MQSTTLGGMPSTKKPKAKRLVTLNIRTDEETRSVLVEIAERENRTMSNLVDTILRDFARDYLARQERGGA